MEKDQDFSTNSCESFAWWDQSTLCWRMWQRCLLEGWTKFSERLPRMGTMRNGRLYQRKAWVRRTDATECSSSDIWPTPTTSNAKGASKKRYFGSPEYRGNLDEAVRTSEHSSQLNPVWVEWLMGFPSGWTDLDA